LRGPNGAEERLAGVLKRGLSKQTPTPCLFCLITQAALSQMEAGGKRLRKATLEKMAAAMDIRIEQLR